MKNAKEFKTGKRVKCTTDNREFVSCTHAGSEYGVHPSYISAICNGIHNDYKGKHFRWLDNTGKWDRAPKPQPKPKNTNWRDKAVYCITDDKEFPSGKKAGEYYGIPANGISDCCNGKLKKTHKMRFCFVADKEKYAEEIAAIKASKCTRFKVKPRFVRTRKGV